MAISDSSGRKVSHSAKRPGPDAEEPTIFDTVVWRGYNGGLVSRAAAESRTVTRLRAKENPPINRTRRNTFVGFTATLRLAPLVALCAADTPKPPANNQRPHPRRR
jgi:hypothetical protein